MASTDDSSQVSARRASNLAIAFKLAGLSKARCRGMEIFYAFCRVVDDIVDEPGPTDAEKHAMLDAWRATIRGYFDGSSAPHDALGRELAEVVKTFDVPRRPLLDIIDGVSMDIVHPEYENFEALRRYCYGVASAVGLVSIRIFGCRHAMSEAFAEAMGYALQFTNILRDVVDDRVNLDRVYLPRDEMRRFGVTPDDLLDPARNPEATAKLFGLQYFRAKHFFEKARRLVHPEDREALKAAFVMGAFYEAILEKIRDSGFRITVRRMKLSKWEKLFLMRRTPADAKKTPSAATPKRVIIIGAGVAGIAAAGELAGSGHTVELLEAKVAPGGRASSFRHAPTGVTLDNGQHAVMGCYDSFLDTCDRLGVRDKFDSTGALAVSYRSAKNGRASRLAATWPEPFHGLGAILGFSELSWRDKCAVLRFGVALRFGAIPRERESAASWLARRGQPAGAIRALWEPFCLAALNEPLATGDARVLRETLVRSLFADKAAGAVLLPREGLGDIFEPELSSRLAAVGGALRTRAQVKKIIVENGRAAGVELADGETLPADAVILATGWKAAAVLAPEGALDPRVPAALAGNTILNVHLFTKSPVTREAMTGVLDSPVQWIFDRTAAGSPPGLFRCAITLSSPPADWENADPETIVTRTVAELEKAFPEAGKVAVEHSFVCKCKDATFATRLPAGLVRPGAKTGVENLFLAGDWTDTGLPATLEGAAFSGWSVASLLE